MLIVKPLIVRVSALLMTFESPLGFPRILGSVPCLFSKQFQFSEYLGKVFRSFLIVDRLD